MKSLKKLEMYKLWESFVCLFFLFFLIAYWILYSFSATCYWMLKWKVEIGFDKIRWYIYIDEYIFTNIYNVFNKLLFFISLFAFDKNANHSQILFSDIACLHVSLAVVSLYIIIRMLLLDLLPIPLAYIALISFSFPYGIQWQCLYS